MDNRNETLDTMLERGEIILNGYKFVVKPLYLKEEPYFFEDVPISIYPKPKEGQELTDKDLSHFAIALFSIDHDSSKEKPKQGFIERIKRWYIKHFVKDYRYYSDNPSVLGLVKWIEQKVYYKGRLVRFYDLERKFNLSKSEIVKLFGFFQEISGF